MSIQCRSCGSENLTSRGVNKYGVHAYKCKECPGWAYTKDERAVEGRRITENSDGSGVITNYVNHQIKTLEDLIEECEIDTSYWEIERWQCNKWEVGAKNDNNKIEVTPLFQVKVWLRKRIEEQEVKNILAQLADDAKVFAPKYPEISYPKHIDGMLYEIDIPDIHFGRLTWNEESGEDYDIKIAYQTVNTVLDRLLLYARQFPISRILLPLGNDFFNVDSKLETTTRGTPQQEDTRWQKTFSLGRELVCTMIDKCSIVAPVDVMIVVGNHDEQRMYYLGATLEGWYHNNPNVTINNEAKKRKYYKFEKNLIGFTHGYWEKLPKLPYVMALEQKDAWSQCSNFEWHLGDKHHKKDLTVKTDEGTGMTIRILRSLAGIDTWTFDMGFIGPKHAAESFLWHPQDGVIGQFTAYP